MMEKSQSKSNGGSTEFVWSEEVERSCLSFEEVPQKSHDSWWSNNQTTRCDQPPVAPPVGINFTTRPYGNVWVVREKKEKKSVEKIEPEPVVEQLQQPVVPQPEGPVLQKPHQHPNHKQVNA